MGIKAIITAGGGVPRSLAAITPVSRKALVEVGGRSLLTTAVEAAQGCRYIDGVVVIGNEEVREHLAGRAEFLDEGGSLIENIERGYEHFGGDSADYLTISPDLPFLSADCLNAFLGTAPGICDLGAPLVDREDFLRCYPGAPNTFVRLAGGRQVTTGSCFYLTGPALRMNFPLFNDLFRYRKHPHRMAIMLGLRVIWGFFTGTLTLGLAEERATQLTGATVRAVEMTDAAIAYDIDNQLNYEFAQSLNK